MTENEIRRLQSYLRTTFGCDRINIARGRKDDSAEVSIGDEFIGVIYRDDEDGDLSYAFQMAILEMDLPRIAG